jgi:serine/threonine protein phosphatase 1
VANKPTSITLKTVIEGTLWLKELGNMRIAIGDVHGCLNELRTLVEDRLKISKEDQLYFVGDLITKGPNSLGTIEYLTNLKQEGYQISSVLGNHEYRILNLYHNDFALLETYLEHYRASDLLDGEVNEVMDFLSTLPYYIDFGDIVIAHSELGLLPTYSQIDARAMFGSDKFAPLYASQDLETKVQIFGHRARTLEDILMDTMMIPRMIGIDGGCVYPEYGYLCALDLDTILLTEVKRQA